jgi:hypothetical protein
MSGNGSLYSPFDLATAIASGSPIRPGATVYLRAGTYTGEFVAALNGSAESPINVKPYPNERVIIDGDILVGGSYTRWYDIEKTQSGEARSTLEEGSAPADIDKGDVFVTGPGVKLINWIIYDNSSDGIGFWQAASGAELYGCIIFNNGWDAPDRGHGHSLYTQNAAANDAKSIKMCVLGPCFGASSSNLSLYGSEAAELEHYNIENIVVISGRSLVGGDAKISDISIDASHFFGGSLQLGYHDLIGNNAVVNNCKMARNNGHLFSPEYMQSFTLSNSTIVFYATEEVLNDLLIYSLEPAAGITAYTMSGNAYHYLGVDAAPFVVGGIRSYDFTGWKARYSVDADSTFSTSLPSDSTHVYPNEYKAGRGMIVVWNWTEAASVSVDVSSVLEVGDNYRLRSAVDYFGDIATGTVAVDGTITIDMRAISHSVALPRDWETALMDNPFPTFGCFILDAA